MGRRTTNRWIDMKVLSLFWGIEAGRVALDILGIKPESYHSAELDPYPMKVSAANYPDITHIGSVTEVSGHDYEGIDLLIGWPPCQDLSIAGKRAGLEGSRSSLFWEYVRILNESKPKFFLVENVASMPKEAKAQITEALFGIEPVLINSALVSAQNRKRLFWVGKRNEDGTYSKVEVPQPEDRWIVPKDILEPIPLTDERWKPLDTKYIEAVSKRIAGWSENQKRLIAYQSDAKRSTAAEHVYAKEEWKTDSCTVAHVPKTVIAQFRRTDLRVHADQDSTPTLTANMGTGGNNVPICIKLGSIGSDSQGNRIYSTEGKWATLSAATGGLAWKSGILILNEDILNQAVTNYDLIEEEEVKEMAEDFENRNLRLIPETGYYWRKLTVRECARLQTFPDTFSFESVSNSRAYKGIGNSWTVEVIAHIFRHIMNNYD